MGVDQKQLLQKGRFSRSTGISRHLLHSDLELTFFYNVLPPFRPPQPPKPPACDESFHRLGLETSCPQLSMDMQKCWGTVGLTIISDLLFPQVDGVYFLNGFFPQRRYLTSSATIACKLFQ